MMTVNFILKETSVVDESHCAAANDHQMRRRLENDIYLASWTSCVEICAIINVKLPFCCCCCCSLAAVVLFIHPITGIDIVPLFSGNHGDTPTIAPNFLINSSRKLLHYVQQQLTID